MTLTTLARHTGTIGRRLLLISVLSFIGLLVGFGCVLLPPAAPIGVVGVAALVLLWVMPDLQVIPERWARFMLMPFFFSIQCVPVYYAIILPGMPWISIRRVFLFLFIVPLCVMMAGSSKTRSYVRHRFAASQAISVCLIGFLASVAVSTVTAIKPFQTLNADIMLILTAILPMIAVVTLIKEENAIITMFRLAVVCVGVNLIVGSIEHFLQKPFLIYALPSYMRDQIIEQNPLAMNAYILGQGLRGGMYRAASTFTNSLTWGEMSAILAPMCLHFMAHGRHRADVIYGMLGISMCLLSVFFSGSRGAYVGVIGATVVYTIVWALRSCQKHPENLAGKIWLVFYMMASSAAMLAILFVQRIHNMVLGGGDSGYSTQARFDEWALAQPHILARPFSGYGGGAAADVIHYTGFAGPSATPSVDCYILNLLVDYGIPGFIFFTAIFFIAIAICLRTYIWGASSNTSVGGALGASMIAFVIYRLTLSQTDSLAMAFMLVGLTIVYRRMVGVEAVKPASDMRAVPAAAYAFR